MQQGSPYACEDHRKALEPHEIPCTRSRSGDCFDNAATESLFETFMAELGEKLDGYSEAKEQAFGYVEVFYSQKRRHSTFGYISPAEHARKT